MVFVALIFVQCSKKTTGMTDAQTTIPNSETFRKSAPGAGAARSINIGKSTNFQLDNGLTVIVVENHKLPRVSYQISMKSEPLFEGDMAGYTGIAGNLINKGTTNKTKAQIDQEIDFIGATLNTGGRGMFISSLKKHSPKLMDIFTDILYHANFPEEEFEKIKQQTLSSLAQSKTDANTMSNNVSSALVYGKDHAYGEIQTEKTTKSITLEKCKEYFDTYFVPNNSYLIIVGDISPAEAKINAEKYFGPWKKGEVIDQKYAIPAQPDETKIAFVHKDNAVQSVISIDYPVNLKPGSQDVMKARLMNSILGGGIFSGRLMQNLREDKAFTYGARSSLSSDRIVGNFSAGASVRNEVTDSAVHEFLFEFDRLVTEKVEATDLQLAKNSMAGGFARSLEQPQTIARFALSTYRNNLPADYYETYLQRLEAVTIDDVMEMAKKYIKPENAYITVVGDKELVAEKLIRFNADGEIDYYDAFGEVLDYDAIALPEGVDGSSVLADFFSAVGGKDKLMSVNTMITSGGLAIMGQNATMSIKQKKGEKFAMSMDMNGMNIQSQKFDGVKALNASMGSAQISLEGSPEYDALKKETTIFKELNYQSEGYEMDLTGIEDVNDVKCYKVKVTSPDGKLTTEYFSINNGLVLRSVRSEEAQGQSLIISTDYGDYKDVDGILLPHILTISGAMPQPLTMTIESYQMNVEIADSEFAIE